MSWRQQAPQSISRHSCTRLQERRLTCRANRIAVVSAVLMRGLAANAGGIFERHVGHALLPLAHHLPKHSRQKLCPHGACTATRRFTDWSCCSMCLQHQHEVGNRRPACATARLTVTGRLQRLLQNTHLSESSSRMLFSLPFCFSLPAVASSHAPVQQRCTSVLHAVDRSKRPRCSRCIRADTYSSAKARGIQTWVLIWWYTCCALRCRPLAGVHLLHLPCLLLWVQVSVGHDRQDLLPHCLLPCLGIVRHLVLIGTAPTSDATIRNAAINSRKAHSLIVRCKRGTFWSSADQNLNDMFGTGPYPQSVSR